MTKDNTTKGLSNTQRTKYIYLKSEKLSFALYKISDFITDNEPVKYKMKELSLSLLTTLCGLDGVTISSRTNVLNMSFSLIRAIQSLLSLAHAQALVSGMNYSILAREFNEIEEHIMSELEYPDLDSLDFTPNLKLSSHSPSDTRGRQKEPKETLEHGDFRHTKAGRKLNQDRRRKIVEFLGTVGTLGKNGSSSIKEICTAVPGFSEKTVQRELATLIQRGEVERTGERRWSRYALVQLTKAFDVDAPSGKV